MATANLREIDLNELKINNGKDGADLWVLVDGLVYDMTSYDHPGGKDILEQEDLDNYQDKFEEFEEAGHSPTAKKLMQKYLIGRLKE